ncbi:MAG TPA: UDP-N-acetylglucosamine 2-epimerase (non-hydrolyzing) [Burkholderiales bacterium]
MALKVMTIVGTRPELIKLSRVIAELDACLPHILVHTGQNFDYELSKIFFEQLEIREPNHFLEVAAERPAQAIANIISKSDEVLEKENPDALLLLGDTNSCLAAIAAKRRKIPIFHMEAGNRCFDERTPEEINRKIVDHVSDINLPYSEHARRYLLAEGLKADTVIKTGSPMREVLQYYMPKIERSGVLKELAVTRGGYFLVSAHREENVDAPENLLDLLASIRAIGESYRLPVIVSTHPRTRKRLEEMGHVDAGPNVRFLKPLGFLDYVKLQMHARCVISDSGTITEESSIVGFPAITIRNSHERPEGMDEGTLILAGLRSENVLKSIEVALAHHKEGARTFRVVPDYEADNVSKKVVRLVLSYVGYVNRNTWHR